MDEIVRYMSRSYIEKSNWSNYFHWDNIEIHIVHNILVNPIIRF